MPAQPVAPPPPDAATPYGTLRKASLYVGDLDPQVTETDLLEAFRYLGPLASVRLCRDRFSQQSLRYGYINFFSQSHASKAIAWLNHTELKGKPMRIMWSQRNPLPRKTGIGNVFVKNLGPSITSARLQRIFCKFGTILSCKVAEECGKSKGFGFVQFDSEDSSMAALNALHGTVLEGKTLYVSKFVRRSERKNAYEEPQFTNLYVKNLGGDVAEAILQEKFSEFGKVRNAVIMKDAEGKSRGFGFVNFESHEEAKKAVEALNGALLGSEKLFVGKAQRKAEREELLKHKKPKASNLYVKNLNASIDDRKLEEHFSTFGKVTSAKVMLHDYGLSKGFGFVCFSNPEEAMKALSALHGTLFHGRPLYVAIAQPKEERQRELQTYYAQPFYPFDSDIFTPQFSQTYSNQPMMYQYLGRNDCGIYPSMPESYQRDVSKYIPTRESQEMIYADNVCQYPMRYPNWTLYTRDLNDCGIWKDTRITQNKIRTTTEVSSKGSVAKRGLLTPASPVENGKQNFRKLLYPLVENLEPRHVAKKTGVSLEMNHSAAGKLLLGSPKSLAVQVGKAIQVLNAANSRTIKDGCADAFLVS